MIYIKMQLFRISFLIKPVPIKPGRWLLPELQVEPIAEMVEANGEHVGICK